MKKLEIGVCNYSDYQAPEGWKERYVSKLQAYTDAFSTVELNRTFYKLPQVKTAEKWHANACEGFKFCMKAWQALTHPTWSPTWRKRTSQVPDEWQKEVGWLRPTEANRWAWEQTRAIADALDAEIVVIQCPPSFKPTDKHVANMREFLGQIDRGGHKLAWEPRGDFEEETDLILELCQELDLIHVVDPFRNEVLTSTPDAYVRLHGNNEPLTDFDYKYSDEELVELAEILDGLCARHERVWCMFNNFEKFDDGQRLAKIMADFA